MDRKQTCKAVRLLFLLGAIATIGTGCDSGPSNSLAPAKSSDADLADLAISPGQLDQIFQPTIADYTATVNFLVSSITVTPTTAHSKASVVVNGSALAPGTASSLIALDEGNNNIVLEVISEDQTTTKRHTIQVTRRTIASFAQQAYIKASNTEAGDRFGWVMALSGDTLAIGAKYEESNARGVDGNEDDNSARWAGAVYVFRRDGAGVWSQQAYIKASNTDSRDQFGYSVALSGDMLVVGAPWESSGSAGINGDQSDNSTLETGAVYVFGRDNAGIWTQQAYIKASNPDQFDHFGSSVALSGNTLAVGARLEESGATGVNGDQLDNSVEEAGAVYVFTRDDAGFWTQQAYLKASNTGFRHKFHRLALSDDVLAVGAPFEGDLGGSGPGSGAVYLFVRDDAGTWTQQAYIKASNPNGDDMFGWDLALSNGQLTVSAPRESSNATGIDGNQADNSAFWSGATYIFGQSDESEWRQKTYIKASNTEDSDFFGRGIARHAGTLLVGAPEDSSATGVNGNQTDNGAEGAGAVYFFSRDGVGIWRQHAFIKASNTDEGDGFGWRVVLDGGTLAVAAPSENGDAKGIDGDQADNSAPDSGAVYVFE